MNIPTNWTFKDREVVKDFDWHVREQLPWYEMATQTVAHIVRHYLPAGGLMYDIGASTGNVGRAVSTVLADRKAKLIAIEESKEMAHAYKGPGRLLNRPAQHVQYEPFDVATLVHVLMFLSIQGRISLLANLRKKLRPGGAIIVFDKALAPSGYFGTVTRRLTMDWKLHNGATPHDIVAKGLSL